VTATPPGERHALPALMAAAVLREDRWHVHHLGADLPVDELIGLARAATADLVVLSAASADAVRLAARASREILAGLPGVRVAAGRPGATLRQLRTLARAADA
jgi:orotidine-5'-phosphate decarboxylase